MILNSQNCDNPHFWGKNLSFIIDGEEIDPAQFKIEVPGEFNFLNHFFPNNPLAKEYFKQ